MEKFRIWAVGTCKLIEHSLSVLLSQVVYLQLIEGAAVRSDLDHCPFSVLHLLLFVTPQLILAGTRLLLLFWSCNSER